jgi:hypothetical protein
MDWIRDLGIFIWSVANNWAGYATGGIIVALIWLRSVLQPKWKPSRTFSLGLVFLFLLLASFEAWRNQYRSNTNNASYVQLAAPPKPISGFGFLPVGMSPALDLTWVNKGSGRALNAMVFCKVYIHPGTPGGSAERDVINSFKKEFADWLRKAKDTREGEAIFPGNTAECEANGNKITQEDLDTLVIRHGTQLYVIGALAFDDSIGSGEGHSCVRLEHIEWLEAYADPKHAVLRYTGGPIQSAYWKSCESYITPIRTK